ncbi:MAG: hypothetical protein H6573_07095 [Lewinellaceae bacterium]|nr:hypothetical protein [Phaeodactylibacter sp.]MCB0612019.1 hypothetical protein [Phaeodactylibacter sp.]MCB9347268.1 hypothetical protein [Lewinellaceae bacterium]
MEEVKAELEALSSINMTASGLTQPYEIPIHLIVLNDDDGNPPISYPVERLVAEIEGTNTLFLGIKQPLQKFA